MFLLVFHICWLRNKQYVRFLYIQDYIYKNHHTAAFCFSKCTACAQHELHNCKKL